MWRFYTSRRRNWTRDLHAVLEKVQNGAEVVIEQNSHPVAVLRPAKPIDTPELAGGVGVVDESVAAAARRLATFGTRHGLSLDGLAIKELLRESRP
jgi:antitoxin (DNA-binding transcriptional repressor) of toxin-antitoxin stability system